MDDRQIQEAVARCVAVVVYYRGSGGTGGAAAAMASEIRVIARGLAERGLTAEQATAKVVRPLERELVARYGPAVGSRVAAEFIRSFEGRPATGGVVIKPDLAR